MFLAKGSGGDILASVGGDGVLQVELNSGGIAALSVQQADQEQTMLPLRFSVQNAKRNVGLHQRAGSTLGNYGNGTGRWTALGLSADGQAHASLYHGFAAVDVVFGHPVTSDCEEVFIQVTRAETIAPTALDSVAVCEVWHIAINNQTDRNVTVTLRKAMPIAALRVPRTKFRDIPRGGWVTIPQHCAPMETIENE